MEEPVAAPNLYLVGFMGVGKSAVGKEVAERLGRPFLDSDTVIETRTGKTIPEIFAEDGEAAFREMERQFIEAQHPAAEHVIACGGGLPCEPGMMELLKSRGIVIALMAEMATILDRTRDDTNRPLLAVPDPEGRIRTMLEQRLPVYEQAHAVIPTDDRPISFLVEQVLVEYERLAPHFLRPG